MKYILVKDYTRNIDHSPKENSWSVLEQIAREGTRRLLQQALEKEVEEHLKLHQRFLEMKRIDKLWFVMDTCLRESSLQV